MDTIDAMITIVAFEAVGVVVASFVSVFNSLEASVLTIKSVVVLPLNT